jgi:hypothetical protein
MKILKTVTVDQEVEIDVDTEAIACCIAEDPDSLRQVMRGINNCASFLKAIPDSLIAELTPAQRQLIEDFLRTQAARYSVSTPAPPAPPAPDPLPRPERKKE